MARRDRAPTSPPVNVEAGERVRVTGGPFRGQVGTFKSQRTDGMCLVDLPGKLPGGRKLTLQSLVPGVEPAPKEK